MSQSSRVRSTMLAAVAALALAAGCKQQCFMTECDYNHYRSLGLPQDLECNPAASILPPAIPDSPTPATVVNPDEPIRYMSLNEAFAIALEHGTTGLQTADNPGVSNDNLVTFQGGVVTGSDQIRVLSLQPAIVGANIESALAKFDAIWTTNLNWMTTDRPLGTSTDLFQAGFNSQLGAINTQDATFSTSLLKPLATGGVAGITFRTDYEFTNTPAPVNPSYRPLLQFQFEQPLLQGFGVEINQLRAAHPGSILTPFNNVTRTEGILITRIRFDEARAEFERNVDNMLFNVETAYWNLYGAYWNLYSREQALRQAYEAWRIQNSQFQAGRISRADLAQTRGQYELFRSQRLAALGTVLENERRLRALLGMRRGDGTRIVPADAPDLAPYQPDWATALNQALTLRPELVLARQELKARQLDLVNQRNLLLPDLRFVSTYDINAIGSTLEGAGASNALRNLFQDKFNDWSLGLRLTVPLGFRDAHSAVRQARLNLASSYLVLKDQELKAERFLELEYRQLAESYAQIQALRSQRQAFGEQLQIRFQEFLAGRGTLDILLESQRFWADALANEYLAIVQYNNSLAGLQFGQGTLLQYDNVVIGEGPLPGCAAVRAVEHERRRSQALVLHERAEPVVHPPCNFDRSQLGLPQLPADSAPSLPALMKEMPRLPSNIPEQLPTPPAGVARLGTELLNVPEGVR